MGSELTMHPGKSTLAPKVAESFHHEVMEINWDVIFGKQDLGSNWSTFKEPYPSLLEKHVPHKSIKPGQRYPPSWLRYHCEHTLGT